MPPTLDTYSVPFVALILVGIIVAVAVTTALIVGPICRRRGRAEVLRTLRPGNTLTLSDYRG